MSELGDFSNCSAKHEIERLIAINAKLQDALDALVILNGDEFERLKAINAELLMACKLVQQRLKNNGYHIDELDAAIAKATGAEG